MPTARYLSLLVALLAGCPGSGPAPSVVAAPDASVPYLRDPVLLEAFGDRPVVPASPPSALLRWQTPPEGCSLAYAMRQRGVSEMEGHPAGPSGVHMTMPFHLARSGAGATLVLDGVQLGFIGEGGASSTGGTSGDGATVSLSTDGRHWTATADARQLWAPGGGQSTTASALFPDLPADTAPGSSSEWAMPQAPAVPGVPAIPPVKVVLRGWVQVGAERAADLSAEWSIDGATELPAMTRFDTSTRFQVQGRTHARWLVLESGRLLWASVRGTYDSTITMAQLAPPMRSAATWELEGRLLSQCGTPALAPFSASPTERATEAWTNMAEKLSANDPAGARQFLATPLHSHVGGLALLVQRFGPDVLGVPVMMPDLETRGTLVRMVLHGSREGRSDLPVEVSVTVDVAGAQPRVTEVRVLATSEPTEQLFYLAPFSFQSAADGWTPTPGGDAVLTTRTALSAPIDRWILVRRGDDRCAVRFRSAAGGVAAYEWAHWPSRATTRPIRGTEAVREPWNDSGDSSAGPAVDSLSVRCGAMQIPWSAPTYLYLDDSFDVTTLGIARLEDIDPRAAGLTWLSRRWGVLAYDAAAESRVAE